MNYVRQPDYFETLARQIDEIPTGPSATHAYSAPCNCDACFEAWLAMPEPTAEERQAMARRFMALVAPSSGGELLTDWPGVSFPDLRLSDEQLVKLSIDQNRHVRLSRGRGL